MITNYTKEALPENILFHEISPQKPRVDLKGINIIDVVWYMVETSSDR